MRIRFARPRDRRVVAALCRRAVGRDDYVLRLLDDVIRDGGLLVAFEGTRAVAMMNSIEVTDGSLWLSMARTDPRHQGRGVAAALVERLASIARRRGVRQLRLWTNGTNRRGNAAAKRAGFHEVGRFVGAIRKPLRQAPRSRDARPVMGSALLRSGIVRDGRGYLLLGWYFVPATVPVLRSFSRQGILRRLGRTWVASPHALKPGEFEWFEFAVLRGDAAEALREGARLAHAAKAQRAFTYLPRGKVYLAAIRKAGYNVPDWATDVVLYERRL